MDLTGFTHILAAINNTALDHNPNGEKRDALVAKILGKLDKMVDRGD